MNRLACIRYLPTVNLHYDLIWGFAVLRGRISSDWAPVHVAAVTGRSAASQDEPPTELPCIPSNLWHADRGGV